MQERKDLNNFAEGRDVFTKCLMTSECRAKIPKRWSILFSTAAALTELVQYLQLVESADSWGKLLFRPIPISTQSLWWQRKRQSTWVSLNSGRTLSSIFYIHEKEAHKAFNSVIQGEQRTLLSAQWSGTFPLDGTMTRSVRMLLQVHDSIVWEIKRDMVDKYPP